MADFACTVSIYVLHDGNISEQREEKHGGTGISVHKTGVVPSVRRRTISGHRAVTHQWMIAHRSASAASWRRSAPCCLVGVSEEALKRIGRRELVDDFQSKFLHRFRFSVRT